MTSEFDKLADLAFCDIERKLRSARESDMDHPAQSGIEAHGDAIGELLDRIKESARLDDGDDGGGGGNGSGNNGGGGGRGDGGGEDPYSAPATIRMLLDAAKQMAEAMRTIALSVTEQQAKFTSETTDFLTDAIIKGREADQERTLELAKQLHGTSLEAMQATTRLAQGIANRFEAAEKRIGALERELALLKSANAADDAGSGP